MARINGHDIPEHKPAQNLDDLRVKLKRIMENVYMDFYGMLGNGFDPYDTLQDVSGWSQYPYVVPAWYRQSLKRGEVLPIYLDWNALRFLRDRSRKLCSENPFCQCAVDNMQNYVVGEEGFIIRAVAADPECPTSLLNKVQKVIDLWQEANDLPEIENDIIEQGTIDGEYFARHFPQKTGLILHRPVEPEHVRPPGNENYSPKYSFGIQTDPDDIQTREGYWIVDDPINQPSPGFVPASQVTHFKFNTRRSAKRGLPTFFSCELLLRDAVDLLRGTVVTANIRARYAVVRKFTSGIIKDAAQRMLGELNMVSITDPGSGISTNVEKKPFGSVVSIGGNQEIEFPSSNMESEQFRVALQMVLRAVAARLNMPEWMLSADSSNGGYSSSMVSEAPSTKKFGRMQKQLGKKVGEYRTPGRESLAWLQILHCIRRGVLPPETARLVKLQCKGPSLIVRDKAGEANVNKAYFAMGIKSSETIQAELGLNPDNERAGHEKDIASGIWPPIEIAAKMMTPGPNGEDDPSKETPGQYAPDGKDGSPPAGRAPLKHNTPHQK